MDDWHRDRCVALCDSCDEISLTVHFMCLEFVLGYDATRADLQAHNI